jgi:hypothetical protein
VLLSGENDIPVRQAINGDFYFIDSLCIRRTIAMERYDQFAVPGYQAGFAILGVETPGEEEPSVVTL